MRSQLPGVYKTQKKDNSIYYRASITYRRKHISLGSFDQELQAYLCYKEAGKLIEQTEMTLDDYDVFSVLSYDRFITLLNFRDNHIYINTPIYLRHRYFEYHLTPEICLKFDTDDLFYYSSHKIMYRKNHLFVADYGMQVNIQNRYGIKNYAVLGRDYDFRNHDIYDYRYQNILILNRFQGVLCNKKSGKTRYIAKIHIVGDYLIGIYDTENEAAIAYNKAVDILHKNGVTTNYCTNYTEALSPKEYADIYSNLKIRSSILNYHPKQESLK